MILKAFNEPFLEDGKSLSYDEVVKTSNARLQYRRGWVGRGTNLPYQSPQRMIRRMDKL